MLLESPAGPLTLVTEYMKVNPTTKCMIHATKKFHVQSFVTRDNTIRCALIHIKYSDAFMHTYVTLSFFLPEKMVYLFGLFVLFFLHM